MAGEITLKFLGDGKTTVEVENFGEEMYNGDQGYFEYTFTNPMTFYIKSLENLSENPPREYFGITDSNSKEYIAASVEPPYIEIIMKDDSAVYSETCCSKSVMKKFYDYVVEHNNQVVPQEGSITFAPLIGHSAPAAGGKRITRKRKTKSRTIRHKKQKKLSKKRRV